MQHAGCYRVIRGLQNVMQGFLELKGYIELDLRYVDLNLVVFIATRTRNAS